MMALKDFDYYIVKGIVKKRPVDVGRVESLRRESENTYFSLVEYVDSIGIGFRNSNLIVRMVYDSIMELIRARMLIDGFVSSGYGAHEAEVSYLRRLDFSESDVEFVDKLRYFRNGILYYGKVFDEEYAKKVLDFLKRVKDRLVKDG